MLDKCFPNRLRLSLFDLQAQRQCTGALLLLALGIALLAIPVKTLSNFGWVRDPAGTRLVPAVSFYIGSLLLAAAVWVTIRALATSKLKQFGTVVLGLICAAPFASSARVELQLAALHSFYLANVRATAPSVSVAYWGISLLAITIVGLVLPLVLVFANCLPAKLLDRVPLMAAIACRRWWLLLPVLAGAVIVAICSLIPTNIAFALGYVSPELSGNTTMVSVATVTSSVWYSLDRISYLPLLVGMWEGMEFAKASVKFSRQPRIARLARHAGEAGNWVLVATVFTVAVIIIAVSGDAYLALGALGLTSILVLSTSGRLRSYAMPMVQRLGVRWDLTEETRSASSIGLVLAIVASPVYVPLLLDLWQGLEAPFRLPDDAMSYLNFWRVYGVVQEHAVTIDDIFSDGYKKLAYIALGAIGFLILGAVLQIFLRDVPLRDMKKWLAALIKIALVAAALIPVTIAADHFATSYVVGAAALPAIYVALSPSKRLERMSQLARALPFLLVWSIVVWHYSWAPATVVLAATIVWKFLFGSKELNEIKNAARRESHTSGYLALAFLGLGLLIMDHGGAPGVLVSGEFSDLTDRIAVAIIAPLWLVHYVVSGLAEKDGEEDSASGSPTVSSKGAS
jgi:hypothetical protein